MQALINFGDPSVISILDEYVIKTIKAEEIERIKNSLKRAKEYLLERQKDLSKR